MAIRNYSFLVFLGFILIFVGFVILVLSYGQSTSGFFFIFPFFFFGDIGPTGLIVMGLMISITLAIFYQFVRTSTLIDQDVYQSRIRCSKCNELLPQNAVFCLRCGNQVDAGNNSEYSDYQ